MSQISIKIIHNIKYNMHKMLGKLLKATTINKIQNRISLLLLGSASVVSFLNLVNKLEV